MNLKPMTETTTRALLALADDMRQLEYFAERVRIQVRALATNHGLAIPLEPCTLSPSEG